MIRTYAYKDIKIGEIFAREEEKTNVADVRSITSPCSPQAKQW